MGSEIEQDMQAELAERVAVNTDNITRLFAEQEKIRDRLHSLEGDRATVLLLAQKLDNLALALPGMVRSAAEQAATEVADRVRNEHTSSWQLRVTMFAAFVAAAGIILTNVHTF
jgi:hypothetical protein